MTFTQRKHLFLSTIGLLLPILAATPAAAYVGPGAGLSLLGALWGVVIAVGAAIGFVILWPLRRVLRKGRVGRDPESTSRQSAPGSPREDVSRHGAV